MHALGAFLLFYIVTSFGQTVHGSNIINGQIVPKDTMLFMVSLQSYNQHICGGFLISEDIVVTAAHCEKGHPDSVLLGSQNLRSAEVMRVPIKQKYIYPTYTSAAKGKDIMILKLSKKISSDCHKTIKPIPIPTSDTKLKDNQICTVVGWGKTENNTVVDDLRSVDMHVVNHRVCQWRWGFKVPPSVICISGDGEIKGACNGDSGGPLVCNGIAVGIASFVEGNCRNPYVPNVYTDISQYLGWINTILQKKSFN